MRGPYLLNLDNEEEAKKVFQDIGCDPQGYLLMRGKTRIIPLLVKEVRCPGANALKQHLLSAGGDAAIARWAIDNSREFSDVLLLGTRKQYERLVESLSRQPWGLKDLSNKIKTLLANLGSARPITWDWPGKQLVIGRRTLVMGILNVTPDSFSDGGCYFRYENALQRAREMAASGADIIDVGGESTRPGAEPVSVREEIDRVLPVLEVLTKELPLPISLDTYKPEVAELALQAGVNIINYVGGRKNRAEMARVAASYAAPVIVMHNPGLLGGAYCTYQDVAAEVTEDLAEDIAIYEKAGLSPQKIMVDPGIGFGKNKEDNLRLLHRLDCLKSLNKPVLLGASRKSFLGKVLDSGVDERLEGSLAVASWAVQKGVDVIRVHDVKETVRIVRVLEAIKEAGNQDE